MTECTTIDIATALDTTLQHATIEAKYQKLRLFSAQKIKSLLGTIDNQTKKLKESRDGPADGRTATIKALKSKLRDQEFIADVLKEDVILLKNKSSELAGERARFNIKAMNQLIIDDTIGGPKRFRQLTREEIENNLQELEILEKQYREQPIEKKQTSRQKAIAARNSTNQRPLGNHGAEEEPVYHAAPASPDQRMHQLQQNQREEELQNQQTRITQLMEEMDRIRAMNANQKVKKENSVLISRDFEELTISMNRMDTTLKDVLERLKESKKELAATKDQQHTTADTMVASIDRAKTECNASLKENNALLSKMKNIERELDAAMDGKLLGTDGDDARNASRQSDQELGDVERKLLQQLKDAQDRKASLQDRVDKIPSLREMLRAKNEEYRILKRDMAEVARTKLSPEKVYREHK